MAIRHAERLFRKDPARARTILYAALREFLGDRFGVATAGVTPEDARQLLTARNAAQSQADTFHEIMRSLFEAGYQAAETSVPFEELCQRSIRLLGELKHVGEPGAGA